MARGKKRILLAGAGGILAKELARLIREHKSRYALTALSKFDLDITHELAVRRALKDVRPHLVINCAAYTAVDDCDVKKELAFLVNAEGAGILARECVRAGSKILHISTDFVFDGKKKKPYKEKDTPHPLSVYGKSKLEGEKLVKKHCKDSLIVRTAWLYGASGDNFVRTILDLARSRDVIRVVSDQVGSPTEARELSQALLALIEKNKKGIYHACGSGVCSRYEFALEIVRLSGMSVAVHPIKAKDYPLPAKRPKNSALDCSKLRRATGFKFKPWQETLAEFFERAGDKRSTHASS